MLGYRLADAIARQLASNSQLAMVQAYVSTNGVSSRCRQTEEARPVRIGVLRNITMHFTSSFYMHRPEHLQLKM
jgi:hypothetical protein